jgi:uracil-DNA glycosylase
MIANEERIKLEASWKTLLANEFQQPYMQTLREFLRNEKQAGKEIYPPGQEYFSALNLTPVDQVKVVIIGQDPYHGPHQAHGLCFSVRPEVKIPPSLRNIYLELQKDLGIPPANHGCLTHWAKQGVLLLNSVLTVEKGKPGSHRNKGWERFTDRIIHILNDKKSHLVFILWGNYAQQKGSFIDTQKHLVLQSAHPSPYSAQKFFGNHHFSQANEYLTKHQLQAIDWKLPPAEACILP